MARCQQRRRIITASDQAKAERIEQILISLRNERKLANQGQNQTSNAGEKMRGGWLATIFKK